MPGAGSFPAGTGPAGFDPVGDPSAPGGAVPSALLVDPFTHDARALAGGQLAGAHPVDQAVALAFGVAYGTIGSVPGQGHTLGEIEWQSKDLEAQVESRARQALAALIQRGDVRLRSVVTTRLPSGFFADINYTNLRLPPPDNDRKVTYKP